ncbi:saccharopine dehydrogenase C-terminal domain-containing protein [Parvibaculum sp.]|uniref:homospermidine synthase n=1 Tax=Parvibaculum sp. TaxID=2024848 RepID=UPI001B2306BD|nr:saccharopine dehydrogenase C-terminal domain-containing protein [Parvibaculum sp.]MBO6669635.1 homospermidine synthase [Parvibaculum sp.]MBO6692822.1 homospermidine synthase [Parvibaculum sp.]MBO6716067.1 homospermidine synthase [Parvibaculum sp.]
MSDVPKDEIARFGGRMVMVGFGSIGQGVLPLLLRHLDITPDRITIVTAEERGKAEAEEFGVKFVVSPLRQGNYLSILEPLLSEGDFLVNLSVDVSSLALVEFCRSKGALYLDTCIEPWSGQYTDAKRSPSQRSNYALRESALALRQKYEGGPTAILTHGANPGLVSHFVKQALLDIARETGVETKVPATREEWARLSSRLGIKAIHIAERDTQVSPIPKAIGEFVNTWSVDGFVGEGCQPAELGWGTHERHFPADGNRHSSGSDCAIYLSRPGASTRVRSWTPNEGPYHGWLITHGESISLADYLTLRDGGEVKYRPTVHYAYHPCHVAVLSLHELAGKNWKVQKHKRLMMEEISEGADELGVLLMGHAKGAYWYGSNLSIEEARRLVPHNNATSLQVTVAVLAGVIWAIENPQRWITEPEEMDFSRILEIARPYLGEMIGAYSDWTPLLDRGLLFPEDIDEDDPWQFKNFRVV